MERFEQKLWEIMGSNYRELFRHLCKLSWELDFKGAMSGFEDKLWRECVHVNAAIGCFAQRFKMKKRGYERGDYNIYFDYHDQTGIYVLAISRETGDVIPDECEYWRA